MKFFWKSVDKKRLLLAIIFMLIYSLNGVMLSYIVVYANKVIKLNNGLSIMYFGIISFIAWILIYSSSYFMNILISSMIRKINMDLKQKYFIKEFKNNSFNKESSGVISKLSNDFKLIDDNYFQVIFSTLIDILIFLVSLFYMLYLNPLVSLFFIIFSLLPIMIPRLFSRRLATVSNEWSNANKSYMRVLKESMQGMSVIKSYTNGESTFKRVNSNLRNLENSSYRMNKTQALTQLLSELLSGISFLLPFIIGCYIIIYTKSLSIGSLIGIFLANDRVVGPLVSITDSLSKIYTSKNIIKNMFFKNGDNLEINNNFSSIGKIKTLTLNKLFFRIDDSKNIFVNLKLKDNFKVLITGDSGSGKTILLSLIKGAIKPTSGEVLVNDSVRNFSSDVAYIEQNPYIFDVSVKDNLTLFQNDDYSNSMIYEVLKKVSLFDELGKEQSIYYRCGDNGNKLSGGQKQRIEIARALLRNKSLYLVDEATANLDKYNSAKIRNILFELNAPVIEVAHHFNSDDNRYTDKFLEINGRLTRTK